jgi:hypothetical protein
MTGRHHDRPGRGAARPPAGYRITRTEPAVGGVWLRLLCPSCTTVLPPAYEQASKR